MTNICSLRQTDEADGQFRTTLTQSDRQTDRQTDTGRHGDAAAATRDEQNK